MAPKLTGFSGNSRVRRVLAAAALAGVELDYDSSFSMKSDYKTEEFLKKNPVGYLPFLEDGDFSLAESSAIAEYVTELGANQTILPSDVKERAQVHQWMAFADQEIFLKHIFAYQLFTNQIPYTKPAYTAAVDKVQSRLAVLDKILLDRTYIVGERITLADVFIATALANAFSGHIHAELRKQVPNVVRYFETIINHPKLAAIFDNGKPTLADSAPTYQAPQKEKKDEKPKEAKPAQPKAEKKPKAKEVEEDEDLELAPAEPKQKNPLDDLPKSAFNLEEWKRQYSNLDTKDALKWFYEKFDSEGFSIWRIDFKYNDELTQVFMSSNQVGGFFNRLEASRKYLFGSVGVCGKANDSIITGSLICRGQDIKPVVEVAPDWESYEFKRLDLSNEEDKAYFEGAMAWELTVDGKEWADGKNFK